MKKTLIIFALMLVSTTISFAQCAMCQATVRSSMSNGRGSIGVGINQGILFLLVMPYLTMGILFFYWYKTAKKNMIEQNKLQQRLKEILG